MIGKAHIHSYFKTFHSWLISFPFMPKSFQLRENNTTELMLTIYVAIWKPTIWITWDREPKVRWGDDEMQPVFVNKFPLTEKEETHTVTMIAQLFSWQKSVSLHWNQCPSSDVPLAEMFLVKVKLNQGRRPHHQFKFQKQKLPDNRFCFLIGMYYLTLSLKCSLWRFIFIMTNTVIIVSYPWCQGSGDARTQEKEKKK